MCENLDKRIRWPVVLGMLLCLAAGCPASPDADLAGSADLGGPVGGDDDLAAAPKDLRGGDGPTPDVDLRPAPPPGTGLCTPPPNRWCWENPLPQGNELLASWASSATDVWAAGWSGTLMHFDGASWSLVPSGTDSTLTAMWGSAANNVWAVGSSGTIVRWNGTSWQRVPSGTTIDFTAIWGTGATDAWAGGRSTSLWRWNGASWQEVPNAAPSFVTGLWGSSPSDYWVGTSAAEKAAARFDGMRWTQVPTFPATAGNLRGVYGTGPNNVLLTSNVVNRWNGMTFDDLFGTFVGVAEGSMWASSATDIWALTAAGNFNRWGGTMWSVLMGPTVDVAGGERLRTFQGVTADDVWAFSNRPHHFYGGKWDSVPGGKFGRSFQAGWAIGPDDAWVIDQSGPNSSVWRKIAGRWTRVFDAPQLLLNIWGSGSNDIWVVGNNGFAAHWDGVAWRAKPTGTSNFLTNIHGVDERNVLAVGSRGTALRWDGTNWSSLVTGTTAELSGVWMTGPGEAWVSGRAGTLLRWNSISWQTYDLGTATNLYNFWGTSRTDLWLVSGSSSIFYWNGLNWNNIDTKVSTGFFDIYGTSSRDVFAINSSSPGFLGHWDGTRWSTLSYPARDLSSIFGYGTRIWLIGGYSAILRNDP